MPPAIGPGTVRTAFPPETATVPGVLPPERVAETNVEFAGVGMVILMLLTWFTVKPEAELGTDEAPGAIVMATAEPDAAEPGAVPLTVAVMLEVWPMPQTVPLQAQFTLTEAAFAGVAKQKTVATAIGAIRLARSRGEVDRMAVSRNVENGTAGMSNRKMSV